jgi:hypothetical protein
VKSFFKHDFWTHGVCRATITPDELEGSASSTNHRPLNFRTEIAFNFLNEGIDRIRDMLEFRREVR